MHVFLSYNHKDKPSAAQLAAQLRLVGADVWLDDWEIRPGDSIVGKVNQVLSLADTVVLLWSENAAVSRWVNSEMESALSRGLIDGSVRIIPVRLDATALPPLLQPLRFLWADAPNDLAHVVRQVMGLGSNEDFIKAIQQTIDRSGLPYEYFHGYGVMVGCPRCGVSSAASVAGGKMEEKFDCSPGSAAPDVAVLGQMV